MHDDARRDDKDDVPPGAYANHFRVGYNAFEFVLDFGQLYPDRPVRFHTRIVTTPAHAKAFYVTLSESIQRFEQDHGPIRLDGDEAPPTAGTAG